MSSQLDNLAEIFHLALDGKKQQAIDAALSEKERLAALKADLSEKLASVDKDLLMVDKMVGKILPKENEEKPTLPPSSSRLISSGIAGRSAARRNAMSSNLKEKRDSAIIQTAKDLGMTRGHFESAEVASNLKMKGVQMYVDANRVNTVISRLLLRHQALFEKVDTGIYKLKNA